MVIDFKHGLPIDEARDRLAVLGKYLQNRHGIKVTWSDPNRATFDGKYLVVSIHGEISLDATIVKFRGKDPGFLWRKKATDYIHSKLKAYLDPATKIEDLSDGK